MILFLLIKTCLQNFASIFWTFSSSTHYIFAFIQTLVDLAIYLMNIEIGILSELFSKNPRNFLKKFILQTQRCIFVFYGKNHTMEMYHLKQQYKQFVGNKAKERISKRLFQEDKARQIFRKTNISYPLIRTRTTKKLAFSEEYKNKILKMIKI